jgi:hypothetical protein
MIVLESLTICAMVFGLLFGLIGACAALDEGIDGKMAAVFLGLAIFGAAFGYLEVSTFSIKEHQYAIITNGLKQYEGFYKIDYYYEGQDRQYKTSEHKDNELIKSNKPEDICIVRNEKLNAFGTASWTNDEIKLELCNQRTEGE